MRNNIRIVYLRHKHSHDKHRGTPYGCLVIKADYENKTLHYGVSTTHPNDVFEKEQARTIAFGRLNKKPVVLSNINFEGMTSHDITYLVLKDILANSDSSTQRLTKLANEWIFNHNYIKGLKELYPQLTTS